MTSTPRFPRAATLTTKQKIRRRLLDLFGTKASLPVKIGLTLIAVVLLLALLFALGVISALLGLLAWNIGVKNIVKAAGGHVDSIGFWTSYGAAVAISFIGRVFHRPAAVETSK